MKKLTLFLTIIIFILVLTGSLLIYNWTRDISDEEASTAVFAATVEDEAGVALSSTFLLTFKDPVSSAAVNKALTVSPEINFGVHQGNSRQEVLITPSEPLSPDTVYTFMLASDETTYSWSIQTQESLRILRSTPENQQIQVALDAPLELVLSSAVTLDLNDLAEKVTISPQIEGDFIQEGRLIRFIPDQPWEPGTVYRVEISPGVTCKNSTLMLEEGWMGSFETIQKWEDWTISGPPAFGLEESLQFQVQGLSRPETTMDLRVDVSIYGFSDVTGYVAALTNVYESAPSWTLSFRYLSSVSTSDTQQIYSAVSTLETSGTENTFFLSPDVDLPEGYYLLRVTYGGESRDLFFMVSQLKTWLLTDIDQALLWCFDQASSNPVPAAITDLWGGDRCVADKQGVGQLAIGDQALLQVVYGDSTLILPVWENLAITTEFPNVWRYLYCDKTVYANGDTLSFYGVLKTRDGSKLDYERVSVYIVPAGEGLENPIYRDYADLQDGMFTGSIVLPQLLSGEYVLQIWQSGLLYAQQSFRVYDDPTYVQPASPRISQEDVVYLDLGDEYTISSTPAENLRLYVQASGGITKTQVCMDTEFSLTFDPENQLDSYVVEVEKTTNGFSVDRMTRLYRAMDPAALTITLESPSVLSCSLENTIELSVQDATGKPLSGATVLVQVLETNVRPEVDPLSAIYGDYQGSGLSLEHVVRSSQSYSSGDTLAYERVTTDEHGYAECSVSMPKTCRNKCYLVAQVIQTTDDVIQAGSLVKLMETTGSIEPVQEEPALPESKYFYEIRPLSAGTLLSADSRLVICASDERLQIMDMLLEPAFSDPEPNQAEQVFSQGYARQLLIDYGGDSIRVLFDTLSVDASLYQKSNGGLGDQGGEADLTTSAIVAAMTPSGVSYYALQKYFTLQLESGIGLTDQAIALAGLASCGQATLAEIKAILQYKETDDLQFCWLIWGLLRNGDRTTAAQLYEERSFAEHASGDLFAWRAVVAAALGHATEALELLNQAEDAEAGNWWAERVLVARALLTRTEQPYLEFSYTVNGETYQASVSGIHDHMVSPMSFGGPVSFTDVDDGVSYCNIFWLETL